MKNFSFTTDTGSTLNSNEMKQLKGGGSCGWIGAREEGNSFIFDARKVPISGPTLICGLTETDAQLLAQYKGGAWCCNDCATQTNGLAACR